jgi:murein DD-endopeptidase MepM/ murein hydrolase activator NlpD
MWKSLFIILALFLFIAIFAGNVVTTVNLTNTPLPPGGPTSDMLLPGGPAQPGLAGQGGCGGGYTVRSGDTLSSIAQGCGVTLQDLLAANPGLANPNVIHPGQVIVVPRPGPATPAAPATAAAPASTATPAPLPQDTPAPTVAPAVAATAELEMQLEPPISPAGAMPAPGGSPKPPAMAVLHPGDTLNIHLRGFPPGAAVRILFGPQGFAPSEVGAAVADAQGTYNGALTIPANAPPGTRWQVTVQTVTGPRVEVVSPPVLVRPVQ